jgi:hypothetical protein
MDHAIPDFLSRLLVVFGAGVGPKSDLCSARILDFRIGAVVASVAGRAVPIYPGRAPPNRRSGITIQIAGRPGPDILSPDSERASH